MKNTLLMLCIMALILSTQSTITRASEEGLDWVESTTHPEWRDPDPSTDVVFHERFYQDYGIKVPQDLGEKVYGENIPDLEKVEGDIALMESTYGIAGKTDAEKVRMMNERLIQSIKDNGPGNIEDLLKQRIKNRYPQVDAEKIVNGFFRDKKVLFDANEETSALYDALTQTDIWKTSKGYKSIRNWAATYYGKDAVEEVKLSVELVDNFPRDRPYKIPGLNTQGKTLEDINMQIVRRPEGVYLGDSLSVMEHEYSHWAQEKIFGKVSMPSGFEEYLSNLYLDRTKAHFEGSAADSRIKFGSELSADYAGLDYFNRLKLKYMIKNLGAADVAPKWYVGGGSVMNTLRKELGEEKFSKEVMPDLITSKGPNDFLNKLAKWFKIPFRTFKFTEDKVEVDGKSYTHEDYMKLPVEQRRLTDGTILSVENKELVAKLPDGTENRKYLGTTDVMGPVTPDRLYDLQSKGSIKVDEVIVHDFQEGGPAAEALETVTDDRGRTTRIRTTMGADLSVAEISPVGGETAAEGLSRVRNSVEYLKKSKTIKALGKGAGWVGLFAQGPLLIISVNEWQQGDRRLAGNQVAGWAVTEVLMKYGAMGLMRANLVGTILTTGLDIAVFSWDAYKVDQIKEQFGIGEASGVDALKNGAGRMVDFWKGFFPTKDHSYANVVGSYIGTEMDRYLTQKGMSAEQKKQVIEKTLQDRKYDEEFYEMITKSIDMSLFIYYDPAKKEDYKPFWGEDVLAERLSKGMCLLLEKWQKDKELQKYDVHITEKDMRDMVLDTEIIWWRNQLGNAIQFQTDDKNIVELGVGSVSKDESGNTLLMDYYPGGESGITTQYYAEAEKGINYLDKVRELMEGKSCEDLAEELQYSVFIKNSLEADAKCPLGKNTDEVKWEVKKGACGDGTGLTDFSANCREKDDKVMVYVREDKQVFCTSPEIKKQYSRETGQHCVKVTWCGVSKMFEYR